jgi:formylglycine-generating enzyme required for sulfatase activity
MLAKHKILNSFLLAFITFAFAAIPANAAPAAGTSITSTSGIILNWIPPGTFTMGSYDTQDWDAQPPHQVTLTSGFWMGRYEVTQAQWAAVMGTNPSFFTRGPNGEARGNLPMEHVTWFDAIEFCNKLSELEGLTPVYTMSNRTPATGHPITSATVTVNWNANGYRLPTEAEWEYACRAGTTTPWNTGTTITTSQALFWVTGGINQTTVVGSYTPNAWGLYDMHGNVLEWVWDWIGTYDNNSRENPTGATSGPQRVVRGGGWASSVQYLRSADRGRVGPMHRSFSLGFRVVRQ